MAIKIMPPRAVTLAAVFAVTACNATPSTITGVQAASSLSFSEQTSLFPREEKNLRQWDAPVVADLDQDGWPDLVLNDHGFALRIMWNNQGKYSRPYDVMMGDMHGISVADFNGDGNLEIIVARGGGSGSNARNAKIFTVSQQRKIIPLPDFTQPLATMRGRTVKFADLDNDGDLDLINFAFPSKEKQGQSENYLYENTGNGQLVLRGRLPAVKADGQKTLVTDFNNDNKLDLLLYGHNEVQVYQGNGDFSFTNVTKKVLPKTLTKVTAIAEIDVDNDGDFDLYFSRGEEFSAGDTFYDAQQQLFGFYTKRGEFNFDGLVIGDVLNIENLQSQWPNKQVYLGESAYQYQFPGETHSGRDLRLVNSDVLGFPEKMTEKGMYIGYVGNQQWRIAGNIWSPATGVLHGVKRYQQSPSNKKKQPPADVLLINEHGKFSDQSNWLDADNNKHATGIVVADVNNDGFQDLVVTQRGNLISANQAELYLNQAGKGFSRQLSHGILSTELGAIGLGAEALDFDRDGDMDIILGNERGKWHLFANELLTEQTQQQAKHLTIAVGKSMQHQAAALGAVVEVTGCDIKQTKKVAATAAAYSLSRHQQVHFGLANCQQPISVSVRWSNGEQLDKHIKVLTNSQYLSLGAGLNEVAP